MTQEIKLEIRFYREEQAKLLMMTRYLENYFARFLCEI